MTSTNLRLTAPINMGVIGGNNSHHHPEASSLMLAGEPKQSRVISAASSVVSANSLGSSSTKASSVVASRMNANNMLAPAPAGNSDAIKNLMKQISTDQVVKTEQDCPLSSTNATVVSNHTSKSNSPSSSSSSISVAQAPPAPPASSVMQMGAPPHPVAEFLFQLTKMLTDNNSEYIEWRNASIFVHDPPGLEKDILPKYFRHSNYSSFQRQMNYFGFRKIAGKGKMAPCSYVNEHAKEDISSLLFIKRKKTGVSSAAAKLMAQQNRINRTMANSMGMPMGMAGNMNPALMMGGSLGGMGVGGGLPGAGLSNNFSMMGGMGATAAAGNMMSAAGSGALNEQASLLREQQSMLAQLQQAHASALTNSSMGMGGSSQGGIPQAAQNKLNGLGMGNGSSNTGLLTNDQGSVYINGSSNNQNEWNNHPTDAAAAQSLLIQQATSTLGGGNYPQGMGAPSAAPGDSNGVLRVDSAANLRALINQQISMFNTDTNPFASSAMGNLGGSLGTSMPVSTAGMVQQQQGSSTHQVATNGLSSIPPAGASSPAGLAYDLNDIFQNANAPGGMPHGGPASLRQLEQQLLQQNGNAGAPGPVSAAGASMGQSFNFNGFFGGAGNAPQGY